MRKSDVSLRWCQSLAVGIADLLIDKQDLTAVQYIVLTYFRLERLFRRLCKAHFLRDPTLFAISVLSEQFPETKAIVIFQRTHLCSQPSLPLGTLQNVVLELLQGCTPRLKRLRIDGRQVPGQGSVEHLRRTNLDKRCRLP